MKCGMKQNLPPDSISQSNTPYAHLPKKNFRFNLNETNISKNVIKSEFRGG